MPIFCHRAAHICLPWRVSESNGDLGSRVSDVQTSLRIVLPVHLNDLRHVAWSSDPDVSFMLTGMKWSRWAAADLIAVVSDGEDVVCEEVVYILLNAMHNLRFLLANEAPDRKIVCEESMQALTRPSHK